MLRKDVVVSLIQFAKILRRFLLSSFGLYGAHGKGSGSGKQEELLREGIVVTLIQFAKMLRRCFLNSCGLYETQGEGSVVVRVCACAYACLCVCVKGEEWTRVRYRARVAPVSCM